MSLDLSVKSRWSRSCCSWCLCWCCLCCPLLPRDAEEELSLSPQWRWLRRLRWWQCTCTGRRRGKPLPRYPGSRCWKSSSGMSWRWCGHLVIPSGSQARGHQWHDTWASPAVLPAPTAYGCAGWSVGVHRWILPQESTKNIWVANEGNSKINYKVSQEQHGFTVSNQDQPVMQILCPFLFLDTQRFSLLFLAMELFRSNKLNTMKWRWLLFENNCLVILFAFIWHYLAVSPAVKVGITKLNPKDKVLSA